jgi:hypothetical protein
LSNRSPGDDDEPPSDREIEARMRPGGFSKTGFLGPQERLGDVIATDAQTLQTLRLDYAQIAAKLDALLAAAEASPARRASLGQLECRVQVYQGFQICPWARDPRRGQCTAGGGVRHGSISWRIANRETGEEMQGPGLIVHLIRDHHFFEGTMSPNRVDPERLARILGLL